MLERHESVVGGGDATSAAVRSALPAGATLLRAHLHRPPRATPPPPTSPLPPPPPLTPTLTPLTPTVSLSTSRSSGQVCFMLVRCVSCSCPPPAPQDAPRLPPPQQRAASLPPWALPPLPAGLPAAPPLLPPPLPPALPRQGAGEDPGPGERGGWTGLGWGLEKAQVYIGHIALLCVCVFLALYFVYI